MKRITISILLLFLSVSLSFAQNDFKPEVKIGGVIFTGWEDNVDNAQFIQKLDTSSAGVNSNAAFGYSPTKNQFETSKNSFFLERAYINIMASLSPQIKARITPDVQQVSGVANQYFVLIKYANLTYTPMMKDNGMSLGFSLGIIPQRWIEKNEGYWGYRGIAKVLTDYTYTTSATRSGNTITQNTGSYFSSADLGFETNLNLPKGYAELYADVLNGNGYKNLSFDNRFKDFEASLFIHPLAGQIKKKTDAALKVNKNPTGITDLTVGGYMYLGKLSLGENTTVNPADGGVGTQYVRNRFGGMAHLRFNFKNAGFFKIGGELSLQSNQDPAAKIDSVAKTNSMGFSGYLELCPPVKSFHDKLSLIARYDSFDPNTDNSSASITTFNNNTDKQSLLIFALAFKPNNNLTLAVSYQSLTYQSEYVVKYDGTPTKTDSRLIIHGIVNF